jgi:hypothetical protein
MWYFNVRQGDKIVISGNTYTVAGPIDNPANSLKTAGFNNWNPERFTNFGTSYRSNPSNGYYEFLYLMDGIDNDGDGVIDEGFDGIDNDGDGIIDPGFNGLDDNGNGQVDEWYEVYYSRSAPVPYYGCPDMSINSGYGAQLTAALATPPTLFPNEYEPEGRSFNTNSPFYTYSSGITNPGTGEGIDYSINRRPVPSRSARIINLPTNVVIDMTTWNLTQERSRLPIDPYSGNVDIMFSPDGHVLNMGATANPAPQLMPFYHFWMADIEDVHDLKGSTTKPAYPMLPVDAEEIINGSGYSLITYGTLKGERKLVTVNTKTGNIVTNAIEAFDLTDPNYIYEAAQAGSDETP